MPKSTSGPSMRKRSDKRDKQGRLKELGIGNKWEAEAQARGKGWCVGVGPRGEACGRGGGVSGNPGLGYFFSWGMMSYTYGGGLA